MLRAMARDVRSWWCVLAMAALSAGAAAVLTQGPAHTHSNQYDYGDFGQNGVGQYGPGYGYPGYHQPPPSPARPNSTPRPAAAAAAEQQPPQQPPSDIGALLGHPRTPVLVLVDSQQQSLQHTRRLWDALPVDAAADVQFALVSYSIWSVSPAWRGTGVRRLQRALHALAETAGEPRGPAFYALLNATQLLQQRDSAVLLFTGRGASDEDLAQLANSELSARRCKLYVWWTGGPEMAGSGAEKLFEELAVASGGQLFNVMVADEEPEEPEEPASPPADPQPASAGSPGPLRPPQVLLAARLDLQGRVETPVLVDSSVRRLTVLTRGPVQDVTVRAPSGRVVHLVSLGKPLGGAGWTERDAAADCEEAAPACPLSLRLDTGGEPAGLWELLTDGARGSTGAYDVIVRGDGDLAINVERVYDRAWGNDSYGAFLVTVAGHAFSGNISSLATVDGRGEELDTLSYKQENRERRDGLETELAVPADKIQGQEEPYFVQVVGLNRRGEAFRRVTPSPQATGNLLVNLNARSNLTIVYNTQTPVILDVTNNNNKPSRVIINARSSHIIIQKIVPQGMTLGPGETHPVALYLLASDKSAITNEVEVLVQNELQGTQIDLLVTLTNNYYTGKNQDTTKPSFTYKIRQNCKKLSGSCLSKHWEMEATIQDEDSGIRHIITQPMGLMFQNRYLVGMKERLRATYTASCCDPDVTITIIDLQHNIRQYSLNINDESKLSDGEIAGIAVGVILLVIIIIIIIIVTIIIVRKKKKSHTFQAQHVAR